MLLRCCFIYWVPSHPPYAYDYSIPHSRSVKYKENKSEEIFQYFIIYIILYFIILTQFLYLHYETTGMINKLKYCIFKN